MAATTDSKTVILIDDEQHNMTWMIDYLEYKGFSVLLGANANEASLLFGAGIKRAAIIDLNIPVLPPLEQAVDEKGLVYKRFPGLYIAQIARNRGYRGRQIIIYSVHKDPSVAEEAQRLGCTYILKGRPKEIKMEMDSVLEFDPTTDNPI